MSGELVLVGVVHRDPQGEQRLARLLEREAPAAVGLELSAPSVELRRGGRLLGRLAGLLRLAGEPELARQVERGERPAGRLGELVAASGEPFELRAAERWAGGSGGRVELLDDPEAARRAIGLLEAQVLTEANLRALLAEAKSAPAVPEPAEDEYRLARRYFGDPQLFRYHFSPAELAELEARDAHVSAGLGPLLEGGKVVHVAGWEHLVDAGLKTLYSLWKGRARRVLLDAAGPAE